MTACDQRYSEIQEMIADERHEDAIDAIEQMVVECGDHTQAYFDLGNLYYATGRMDKALSHYEKTVELAPENPMYLKNYADLLYSERKDADRALSIYEKILSLRSEDIQTLMVAGHLCVSLKHFAEALKYYNRVMDIEPWNEEAREFASRLKLQTMSKDMSPEAIHQACEELVSQGHMDVAVSGLESLISRYPEFAVAHNDLGVLYYQQGKKDLSQACYEKAVSIEPENPNFQKNLADFYLAEKGEIEKALGIYLSVLKEDPDDIDCLMVAGHISTALGKIESARMFYDRVLDIEPWNMEAGERIEALPIQ